MGVLMTCNENDRLLRKTGRVFNNKAPHGYKVFEAGTPIRSNFSGRPMRVYLK